MAGAMRRMGIYLGLVEDDDPRGYGRYDSRQTDQGDYDRRYGRYADDRYEGEYAEGYDGDLAADAKRLVDFAAGLSYGLRGSIERVTAKVCLLSPQNVDVTAEDKARIRESGFFNQS